MTELKLINEDALKVQKEAAPEIASYLLGAAELAEATVREMNERLKHIERINNPHARSGGAHHYWVAGFEYHKTNSEVVPAAFGYDLQQWKATGSSTPPWRILVYSTPLLDAIRAACEKKGYAMDGFSTSIKFHDHRDGEYLWIPVPSEITRGCFTAPLLAGAINAFLGSIIE